MSVVADMLDKVCTLKRGDRSVDSTGTPDPQYSVVDGMSGVACSVWPASSKTLREFQGDEMSVDYEICTENNIGATRGDLVVVGTAVYEVAGYSRFESFDVNLYLTIAARRNS